MAYRLSNARYRNSATCAYEIGFRLRNLLFWFCFEGEIAVIPSALGQGITGTKQCEVINYKVRRCNDYVPKHTKQWSSHDPRGILSLMMTHACIGRVVLRRRYCSNISSLGEQSKVKIKLCSKRSISSFF